MRDHILLEKAFRYTEPLVVFAKLEVQQNGIKKSAPRRQ